MKKVLNVLGELLMYPLALLYILVMFLPFVLYALVTRLSGVDGHG